LLASLPSLVKTISSDAAPSSSATWVRARSSASPARMLAKRPLEGLPQAVSSHGSMAARTSGAMGVLAL